MLLAIDTSTNLASVALVDATGATHTDGSATGAANTANTADAAPAREHPAPARLLAELTWDVGTRHSVELLERIAWLLASRGATMAQLSTLAVATGPGSFNGARVAVATAKSLAFALALPVIALSTLDVIAWGAGPLGPRWALLDAGRGEVYAARYAAPPEATDASALASWGPTVFASADAASADAASADAATTDAATTDAATADAGAGQDSSHGGAHSLVADGGAPEIGARYHLLTPQRLAALIADDRHDATTSPLGAPLLLAGEWRAATQAALAAAFAAQGVVARYDATPRRAWGLAILAVARLTTATNVLNNKAQLAALEPLYVRRPAITTSAKRALRS